MVVRQPGPSHRALAPPLATSPSTTHIIILLPKIFLRTSSNPHHSKINVSGLGGIFFFTRPFLLPSISIGTSSVSVAPEDYFFLCFDFFVAATPDRSLSQTPALSLGWPFSLLVDPPS